MSSSVNGNSKIDEQISEDFSFVGLVEKEAHQRWSSDSPQKSSKKCQPEETVSEEGIIAFQRNGMKEKAYFTAQDCEPRSTPRAGDKVCLLFYAYQLKKMGYRLTLL